eukprot:jgi/Tetstr1/436657/TSEL_025452.t1
MNASAMEPSTAEAVVKGAGGANRNALGLRNRRSRLLLFHVAAFIEMLEEKHPIGAGWLLENVDTSGDETVHQGV